MFVAVAEPGLAPPEVPHAKLADDHHAERERSRDGTDRERLIDRQAIRHPYVDRRVKEEEQPPRDRERAQVREAALAERLLALLLGELGDQWAADEHRPEEEETGEGVTEGGLELHEEAALVLQIERAEDGDGGRDVRSKRRDLAVPNDLNRNENHAADDARHDRREEAHRVLEGDERDERTERFEDESDDAAHARCLRCLSHCCREVARFAPGNQDVMGEPVQYLRILKTIVITFGALSVSGAAPPGALKIVADPPAAPTAPASSANPIVRGTCDDSPTANFTIAHLNDLQAHYGDVVRGKSRYGYIAGYLRAVKEEEPNTLVLDAGDDYEKGSIADLRSMGEATRRMVQALPIDVRTIGNHDFAYGETAVLRDVTLSAHPVLAANIHYADGRTPFLPYVAVKVGCVRVGVIGLVAGHYGSDDQPDGGIFDGVFVHDDRYARLLREQVEAHRGEVDVMIALTHLGFYTDLELAVQVPEIDVFVGGHSEDLVKDGYPYIKRDGERKMGWVFQAGHYGEHIGRADFTLDRSTHALHLARYTMADVDIRMPYAEDVGRTAHALEHAFTPEAHAPIALARASVDREDMPTLVLRAARDRWAADAAFIGKDVFWTGLPSGPITLQRLFDAVPVQREPSGTPGFTSLWVVTMTGAELLELKQRSFSGYATLLPDALAPNKSYRVVIDKRALEHPGMVAGGVTFPQNGRFAGEIIDVLDGYARARTSRGLPL